MSYHTLAAVAIADWLNTQEVREQLGNELAMNGTPLGGYFYPAVTPFSMQTTLLQIFVLGQRTTTRSGGNTNLIEDGRATLDIEVSFYPTDTGEEQNRFDVAAQIYALFMSRLTSLLRTTPHWIYTRDGETLAFGFDHTYPIETVEQASVDDSGELLIRLSSVLTLQVTFDVIGFDPFTVSYLT